MSAAPQLEPHAVAYRARNGEFIWIRPMSRGDRQALCRLWLRLSPQSIYMRFMTTWPTGPSRAMVEYLTNVGGEGREALVAMHDAEVVAVARYHVLAERDAEVAVLVEDAWQRQGIARALFDELARRARTRGIKTFSGSILGENRAAIEMLKSISAHPEFHVEHGEVLFRFSTTLSEPRLRAVV